MTKVLTAKEKANELGISMRALAKSRHLYKHIPKSSRKYLYFAEDPREAVRPNIGQSSVKFVSRSNRRRNVPFGQTNYSKAPGGSGEKLKVLNQMRSKMALEGRIPKEHQESFNEAEAYHLEKNYNKINEERKAKIRSELLANEERARKNDPSRYGSMNPKVPLVDFSTPWKDLYPQEKSEYDKALEELQGDTEGFKKYY